MKTIEFRSMQRLGLVAALAAICTLMAGCYQIIHVEDTVGKPVAGAEVTTQMSQNFGGGSGPSGITDRFGNTMLKRTAYDDPPLYINVTKQGYRSCGIDYKPDDRITIRIQQIVAP